MEIKDIIKKRRKDLNLTYEELANLCGVGKTTVRKWELGLTENMKVDKVKSLAEALKISPLELLGYDKYQYSLEANENINEEIREWSKSILVHDSITYKGILRETDFKTKYDEYYSEKGNYMHLTDLGECFILHRSKQESFDNPFYSSLYNDPRRLIALIVSDDSINKISPKNSYAIVQDIPTLNPEDHLCNGDLVVVCINQKPAIIRHYLKNGDSTVFTPNSTNTAYGPLLFYADSADEVKIYGKVIGFLTLPSALNSKEMVQENKV